MLKSFNENKDINMLKHSSLGEMPVNKYTIDDTLNKFLYDIKYCGYEDWEWKKTERGGSVFLYFYTGMDSDPKPRIQISDSKITILSQDEKKVIKEHTPSNIQDLKDFLHISGIPLGHIGRERVAWERKLKAASAAAAEEQRAAKRRGYERFEEDTLAQARVDKINSRFDKMIEREDREIKGHK